MEPFCFLLHRRVYIKNSDVCPSCHSFQIIVFLSDYCHSFRIYCHFKYLSSWIAPVHSLTHGSPCLTQRVWNFLLFNRFSCQYPLKNYPVLEDDLLQGASLIQNVSLRFKVFQKMGIYSKKFYPLVFFDEPEKAPEKLAEIFPITNSGQILSEIIRGTQQI